MTISLTDSALLGNLYTTRAMRAIFGDDGRVARMLEVEAALARAQGRLGLIPQGAAGEITKKAVLKSIDMAALGEACEQHGYPVLPLIRQLSAACSGDAGSYVHWGATTQDIMDCAMMLQIRDGLAAVEADLDRALRALLKLTATHRDDVMAGRSHLQQGLPITFGFKCANWAAPFIGLKHRLEALRNEALVVEFAGAVGTLASLGKDGLKVHDALAGELGLRPARTVWHGSRAPLGPIIGWLAELGGATGKIATDVPLMMQTEVGELAEPADAGRGGSSTMPQKRNPVLSEYALAAMRNAHALLPVAYGAMAGDHERSTGPWHGEWLAFPQIFALTAGAVARIAEILEGLQVFPERMRENVERSGGFILAEAAMMALAPKTGRTQAHDLVEAACHKAFADGTGLGPALKADKEISTHLPADEIDRLLDPDGYVGLSGEFTDRIIDDINQVLGKSG